MIPELSPSDAWAMNPIVQEGKMDDEMRAKLEGKLTGEAEAGTPPDASMTDRQVLAAEMGPEAFAVVENWPDTELWACQGGWVFVRCRRVADAAGLHGYQAGYLCGRADMEAKYRALAELVEATALRLEHSEALSYPLSTLAKRLRTALSGGTDV